MQEQMGLNLVTFVAPIFDDEQITEYCKLIDKKVNSGLKCEDLKAHLSVLMLKKHKKELITNWSEFKESDVKAAYDFLESY